MDFNFFETVLICDLAAPNRNMIPANILGAFMKSLVVKRSVVIDGHKTSVSLEDAFWSDLKEIAHTQQATLSKVIAEIDKGRRQGNNLSSAIRLFVFDKVRARGGQCSRVDEILSFLNPCPPSLFEIRHRFLGASSIISPAA